MSLRKPATFAETGWLACWSTALVLPAIGARAWQQRVVGAATALFAVGETTIMAIQAWRGVPSHYNFSTPLDAALMRGGAAGTAAIFIIGVGVLLTAAARSRTAPPAVRLGVLGGAAVLLTGCLVSLVMISTNSRVYQCGIGTGFADRRAAYLGPDAATIGPQYLLLRPGTAGPMAGGASGTLGTATRLTASHGAAVIAERDVNTAALLAHVNEHGPTPALPRTVVS